MSVRHFCDVCDTELRDGIPGAEGTGNLARGRDTVRLLDHSFTPRSFEVIVRPKGDSRIEEWCDRCWQRAVRRFVEELGPETVEEHDDGQS